MQKADVKIANLRLHRIAYEKVEKTITSSKEGKVNGNVTKEKKTLVIFTNDKRKI